MTHLAGRAGKVLFLSVLTAMLLAATALAADIAEGATEDKMKEIAQEELGLISPNQRVFSISN